MLDRIAGVSGGRTFYTDRIEQLEGVFAEIGEDIASQYLLAYDAERAASATAAGVRSGSRWRDRRRATPCAPGRDTGRAEREVATRSPLVVGWLTGFEPATSWATATRSNQTELQPPPIEWRA